MARELITSWGDYQTALDRLLVIAEHKIFIYDEDLGHLALEAPPRLAEIRRVLHAARGTSQIRLAVRNGEPLRREHPLLMNLLGQFGHCLAAQQTAPQLAHLRDAMIIVDDRHGLIRFERDQARSKLLLDEPDELKGYLARFDEIWREGGESISITTLGL
ncbi:MAG: hypothetical protein ACM3X0_03915 [Bacteroidota bacterium]